MASLDRPPHSPTQAKLSRIVVNHGADVLSASLIKRLNRLKCFDGQANTFLDPFRIAIVRFSRRIASHFRNTNLAFARANLSMGLVDLASNAVHQPHFFKLALLVNWPTFITRGMLAKTEVSQFPKRHCVEVEAVLRATDCAAQSAAK